MGGALNRFVTYFVRRHSMAECFAIARRNAAGGVWARKRYGITPVGIWSETNGTLAEAQVVPLEV
jgi:hypothetical protein